MGSAVIVTSKSGRVKRRYAGLSWSEVQDMLRQWSSRGYVCSVV